MSCTQMTQIGQMIADCFYLKKDDLRKSVLSALSVC